MQAQIHLPSPPSPGKSTGLNAPKDELLRAITLAQSYSLSSPNEERVGVRSLNLLEV
jgi:hypothetical protein